MDRLHFKLFRPAIAFAVVSIGCAKSTDSAGDVGPEASDGGSVASYEIKRNAASDSLSGIDLVIHLPSNDKASNMLKLRGHIQQIDVQTNRDYRPARGGPGHDGLIVNHPDSGIGTDTSPKLKVNFVYVPVKKN